MQTAERMWVERILSEEGQRITQIRTNWDYYYGDHKKNLAVRIGKPDDNVTVNLSRLIVDTGVDFLFGGELTWELAEGETTAEEEWLEAVWNLNRRMTLLQSVGLMGGVTGHVFLKIVPDAYTLGGQSYPRLVCLDTSVVRKIPEPDDVEQVRRYIIEYVAVDPDSEQQIAKKQIIEREGEPDSPTGWVMEWWEARGNQRYRRVDMQRWPFPWPPIVDCANLPNPGEAYGLSDLENAALNDAVNSVASKINRILRYHSSPKTWGRGFAASTLETTADGIVVIPSEAGMLDNLEMQSDLTPSREFLADLMELYHHISRTPRLDPAKVNVGALSGFALRILYGPLLAKTVTKQRLYGDMLVELNRRLLALAGRGDDNYVTLYWPDPLPQSGKETAETLKLDRDMGIVSLETAATERGYDWETEKERLAAEQVEATTLGEQVALAWERGIGGEGGLAQPEEGEEEEGALPVE